MEIGTAELMDEVQGPQRKRGGLISGAGAGGNGGGRDPGGGGDGPNEDRPASETIVPEKSRVLTAFLLLVVMMTFGGLIAAYVVIATNNVAEWKPFSLPIQVWISTVLIVISSVAYHFGKKGVDRNDQPAAKKWFVATTVLGAAFISSQILVWIELNARGLYMQGNPYAGFFYILTAVHAVHVLGGITALGAILLKSLSPTDRPESIARRQILAQTVGWYWHFMGILWLVLFLLLGFWT
jgi:cytochrome c oxidase subunit 3